jgi:hypothetical protein
MEGRFETWVRPDRGFAAWPTNKETVTDSGECPVQRWYTQWFAITKVDRQGLVGSSHTAVRSGPTVQGLYTQLWTREAH